AALLDERFARLNPEDMKEIKPLLQHKDPAVILAGLDLILRKKGAAGAEAELAELVKHPDRKMSGKAVAVLVDLGSVARPALPVLLAAIKQVSPERRPS